MSTWPLLRGFGIELRRADDYGPLVGDEIIPIYSPPGHRRQRDGAKRYSDFMADALAAINKASEHVEGLIALRAFPVPANGRMIRLNYHTAPGDLGAGDFVYKIGPGGPGYYVDDDGLVIVPNGGNGQAAWLRVWDKVTLHVGWFGAKCDPQNNIDDYIPASKALKHFTRGRYAITSGVIDFGPGIAFSQPLHYSGNLGYMIKFKGAIANARGGNEYSMLRYTGPPTQGALVFYGANESIIEDLNVMPGLAYHGVMVIADNTYSHTATHAITAGTNVVVTPSGATPAAKIFWLQAGCFLGVGADADPDFEVVYVHSVDSAAGSFIADFKKNHPNGVKIGGGHPSSGMRVNHCLLIAPASPIFTKTTALFSPGPGGGTEQIHTVASTAGIQVGMPLWIGWGSVAETVYVKSVDFTNRTFIANTSQNHPIGSRVMYATSAILFGNRLLGTVQVSEISMEDLAVQGQELVDVGGGRYESKSYAGIRQIYGGNVKNITVYHFEYGYLKIAMALEDSSGQYLVTGPIGAGIDDTLFAASAAQITVISGEDESSCYWFRGGAGSSNFESTFIGCTFQGQCCLYESMITDQMVISYGSLTFLNCMLHNGRDWGVSLPIIVMPGIRQTSGNWPARLTMIGCSITGAGFTDGNLPPEFVKEVPLPAGGGVPVFAAGDGRITMINCAGGTGAPTIAHLPTLLPRQQGKITNYNPLSMPAGGSEDPTIGTMTVNGAALGDFVEATFSLNLQGAMLRAWVSAPNTVSFQFSNPTSGTIDLGSGTVKCRVIK